MTRKKQFSQDNGRSVSGAQRRVWPVFESIKQAAAATHYTESEIKLAKNKGSKAFLAGGRIDSGILIPDLNDILHKSNDMPEGFTSWREVLECEKAKRERKRRETEEGLLMLKADAERHSAEQWAFTFSEHERLENEYPPALAGLPAVDAGKRLAEFTKSFRRNAEARFPLNE